MTKYRLEITKGEQVRFLSHLDFAQLFIRAVRRGKLPAAYSEGFNPHMKVSFASALAVGVTAATEYVDLELTEPLPVETIKTQLNRALPEGVHVGQLAEITGKCQSLMAAADLAVYEITLPFAGVVAEAEKSIAAFNQADEFVFHRVTPKKTRDIEVKQYLPQGITARFEERRLFLTLPIRLTPSGSIKPGEILEILKEHFGLEVDEGQGLINRKSLSGGGRSLLMIANPREV